MTEIELRQKTLEITNAYIELSKEISGVCISDFLKVRELAAKELSSFSMPVSAGSVTAVRNEKSSVLEAEPVETKKEPEKKKEIQKIKPIKIREPEEKNEAIENTVMDIGETEEEAQEPRKLSKFEMLKAMPDEYN